jgi:cytochrome c oxidase cbb3-type subunit 3
VSSARLLRLLLSGGLALASVACKSRPGSSNVALASAVSAAASAPSARARPVRPRKPLPPSIDGAPLYDRYCALCHGKDAKGYVADNAPSLVSQTFLESASNPFIARGIKMGRPGTAMAAYAKYLGGPLEEREIQAIVRFLRSKGPAPKTMVLAVPPGDAKKGARLFQTHCTECHGTEANRGKAPMLFNLEFLQSATAAFLRYAIVHGRPPTEMPAFEGMLKPAEIDDIVTYLRSKNPAYRPLPPPVDMGALAKLPVLMNPKGAAPSFTLREERYVPIEQVKKALEAKNRMVIIDARAASDFVRSHIPGAISNPYYDKSGLDRVPKDDTWVLAYCACPHHASGQVVDELRRRGYTHTAVLDEGILEWQRRGYPVEGRDVEQARGPAKEAASAAPPTPLSVPSRGE